MEKYFDSSNIQLELLSIIVLVNGFNYIWKYYQHIALTVGLLIVGVLATESMYGSDRGDVQMLLCHQGGFNIFFMHVHCTHLI